MTIKMKKYKNYLIAACILILGILIGKISSGGDSAKDLDPVTHEHEAEESIVWTCSMHPQIRMDKPGSCPICGMDLIELSESDIGDGFSGSEVILTEQAVQLANIQTTTVSKGNANKEVRLLGTVKPDERRQYAQVSHLPGRIEKLYVDFTGEKIKQGQKIVRLYSPELISAQKELFEAIKSKDVYPELYRASRNKLKQWKLSDEQIDGIIASGSVQEQMDILSDYSGYVMRRNVDVGDHVMVGMTLFDIANIDKVWVMFEAYESDIPWIKRGDEVLFDTQAIPGKKFSGKVNYIDPFVSPDSRVAKVRVEISNKDHKLLPEMYVSGLVKSSLDAGQNSLLIPKSSLLWTGKRGVVYVKVPHPEVIAFEYREVIIGADLGEFYIIKEGLEEGDVVATHGVFRIDASAQLSGKRSMMNPEPQEKPSVKVQAQTEPSKAGVDKKFVSALENFIDQYMAVKNALVKDNPGEAKKKALLAIKELEVIDSEFLKQGELRKIWKKQSGLMHDALTQLSDTEELVVQRRNFGTLSTALSETIDIFGWNSVSEEKLYLEFCPMVDNNKGGYWLSFDEEIKNPFFGESMLQCGEVVKTF